MYTVAARPQKEKECFETHPFGQQIHITTILETICTLHLLDVLYIYVAVCFALPGLLVSTTCYSSQIFQVNDPVVLPYPLGITEGLFRSSLITISLKEIIIYLKKNFFERNLLERNLLEENIFLRNLFERNLCLRNLFERNLCLGNILKRNLFQRNLFKIHIFD